MTIPGESKIAENSERVDRISMGADRRFRSYRRRLILLITPLALLTSGILAFISARAVRVVATPIICEGAENFLHALASRIQEGSKDDASIIAVLWDFEDSESQGIVLVEEGKARIVVGNPKHLSRSIEDAAEILEDRESGTLVHDYGPFGTWLSVARRLDGRRSLLMERNVDGPGKLYFLMAGGVVVATVVIAILFALVLSGILFRPLATRLQTLQSALMSYEGGDHQIRLDAGDGETNELDEVYRAFNRMADRIEELEEGRRHEAELKRALLADLAHDINTPIAVLRGYAETLVEKGSGMEEGDLLSVYARVLGQSYYVQAIVEDLLAMAYAKGNHLSLTPEEIACDTLFDVVVDSFLPLASEKGIALIGDANGLAVFADPIRLRQILNNLVRNALLHAKGATLIEMGAARESGGVVIFVEDDGPGIPEKLISQVFERGCRGTTPGGPGWGLGLAIVRTLAELHGGWVRYRSVSPGTRFELFFPSGSGCDDPVSYGSLRV